MTVSRSDGVAPAVRIVLLDPREERRSVMRQVMIGECGASVVAEAAGVDDAREAVEREQADVVLLDLRMPVLDGLRSIRELRHSFPALGIVVCSFDLDREVAEQARAEGADGCLAKPVNRGDVVAAAGAACRRETATGVTAAVSARAVAVL